MIAPASISSLLLIALGLALTFLGKKLVKAIAFIIGGLIGALLALMISPLFLSPPFTYLAALIGFVVLGLISYFLLPFGGGVIAGLATFLLLKGVVGLLMAALIALIVLIIVVILFNKILTVGTAFAGSLVTLAGLSQLGLTLPSVIQLIILILLTVLGSIVQFKI